MEPSLENVDGEAHVAGIGDDDTEYRRRPAPRIVQNLCVPSEPEMVTVPIAWLAGPVETVLTPAIVIDPLLVVPDVPMFDITVSVSESGLKCQSKPLVSDMIRSEGHEFQPRLAFWS